MLPVTGLLVLCTVFAMAQAQCSLEGNAFWYSNTTLAFGAAVGDWIPVVEHWDDEGIQRVWYMTFRQATSTRYEIQDHGGYQVDSICDPDQTGQYRLTFSTDCSTIDIEVIYDPCESRSVAFDGYNGEQVDILNGGTCDSWVGTLQETDETTWLSGEAVSIYPAPMGLRIVSIGDYTAIFQNWTVRPTDPPNFQLIQDVLSIPEGFACEERFYGQYFLTRANQCGSIMCGKADSCAIRAALFHGVKYNGYAGRECDAEPTILDWPNNACSDGNIWVKDPYDCVNQFGGDQCLFCRGVANDLDVKLCLDRNGGGCNDIFRSVPAQGWCNLEFECPASTLYLSLFAFLLVILAFLQ